VGDGEGVGRETVVSVVGGAVGAVVGTDVTGVVCETVGCVV